jgi:arylsulfatase A-like enzyme
VSPRPNILVICTDQHRYDAISTHPGSAAVTPHLAELAAGGTVFDQCYAPSPMCAPSRASMLTGEYPSSHGLWANGVMLPSDRSLVSRELADAGYRCGLVGKFHLSAAFQGRTEERLDDGFEVFEWAHDPFHGAPENAYHAWLRERFPELWEKARGELVTPETKDFKHKTTLFDTMPTRAHYSTWVAEQITAFVRERDERPFFAIANFFDPHHPFAAPEEYLAKYPVGSVPPPVGGPIELTNKPLRQTDASKSSYVGHGPSFVDFSPGELDELRRTYYAMVSLVDDCVGKITETLRNEGIADDTLVIFTSDHGELLGDHGMLLKGPMLYDAAVRVPLIAAFPGVVPSGERVEGFVSVHDLAATIRAFAGLPAYERDQGRDLIAIARGEAPARPYAWSEYRNSGYPYEPPANTTMYRRHDYKLIAWHGDPDRGIPATGELYDLLVDPDEIVNLWDDPAYATVRAELYLEMLDLEMDHEDRHQPRLAPW